MPMQSEERVGEQRTLERELYIVLLHLYSLSEEIPPGAWDAETIMRDLGFSAERVQLVLRALLGAGLLGRPTSGEGFVLTPRATVYLQGGAGRRRSVRLQDEMLWELPASR
jgi:hypothetical protein